MRISDWSSDVCSSDLHLEKALQDEDNELHRSIIVVQHQYLRRRRLFGARARTGGDAQMAAILIDLAVRHHGRAFIYVVHLVHASGRIWHAPPEVQEPSADKCVRTAVCMFKMQKLNLTPHSRRGCTYIPVWKGTLETERRRGGKK